MSSLFDFDDKQNLVFQAKTAGKQIVSAKHEALTKLGSFLFLAHTDNEFALRCRMFDQDITNIANRRLASVSDSKGKLVRALHQEWELRHANCQPCKVAFMGMGYSGPCPIEGCKGHTIQGAPCSKHTPEEVAAWREQKKKTSSKGDLKTCAECDSAPATHKDVHGYLELCNSCFKKKSASSRRAGPTPLQNMLNLMGDGRPYKPPVNQTGGPGGSGGMNGNMRGGDWGNLPTVPKSTPNSSGGMVGPRGPGGTPHIPSTGAGAGSDAVFGPGQSNPAPGGTPKVNTNFPKVNNDPDRAQDVKDHSGPDAWDTTENNPKAPDLVGPAGPKGVMTPKAPTDKDSRTVDIGGLVQKNWGPDGPTYDKDGLSPALEQAVKSRQRGEAQTAGMAGVQASRDSLKARAAGAGCANCGDDAVANFNGKPMCLPGMGCQQGAQQGSCPGCGDNLYGFNVCPGGNCQGNPEEQKIEQQVQMIQQELQQLLGGGESIEDVLRHDRGHDDWHRSMGQEPCTSEEDCDAKRQEHEAMEHRASSRRFAAPLDYEEPRTTVDIDNDGVMSPRHEEGRSLKSGTCDHPDCNKRVGPIEGPSTEEGFIDHPGKPGSMVSVNSIRTDKLPKGTKVYCKTHAAERVSSGEAGKTASRFAGMAEGTCEICDAPVQRRSGDDTNWQPDLCDDCFESVMNDDHSGRTFEGSREDNWRDQYFNLDSDW